MLRYNTRLALLKANISKFAALGFCLLERFKIPAKGNYRSIGAYDGNGVFIVFKKQIFY